MDISLRVKAFAEAARAINSIRDQNTLFDAILFQIERVFGLKHCAVLLLNESREHLVIKASLGYNSDCEKQATVKVGRGITGSIVQSGHAEAIFDVSKDPRYLRISAETISEIAAPVIMDGEIIGVIDAESADHRFDENDLVLFEAFADHIGTAVMNARLHTELAQKNSMLERTISEIRSMNLELTASSERLSSANLSLERRIKELQTLYEAGKTITSSLDLDRTLEAIIKMANELIGISAGTIMLIDEDTDELKERVCFQISADQRREIATLEIPLVIGDRMIGTFALSHVNPEAISQEDRRMLTTLASQAAIAIENARLFERTQNSYYDTIRALAQALEARDPCTKGHSERVTDYSLKLAEKMTLSEKQRTFINYAGLLHDIGKIGVSDIILHSKTTLGDSDMTIIREHPAFGDLILSPLKFLEEAKSVVKHHHERWDGKGYPDGLKGDQIPLVARIVAIADSFDAMTSERPYRLAMSREDALEEIRCGAGTQFDHDLALLFVETLTHVDYSNNETYDRNCMASR